MGKGLQKHLKLYKVPKKRLLSIALVAIAFGAVSGGTFAKYYANNSNKGVTAASNYYFTSNVLAETLTEGEEDWKVVYNTDPWDGKGQYPFEVQIQNYQNQLLYNDLNLDITYEISFELLNDDGGTYSVQHGTENEMPLQVGTPIVYEDLVIEGGIANSDNFKVLYHAPDSISENYQSPGIRVVAEITAPDFLANNQKKIGGILHVGVIKAEYSLCGKYDFSISAIDNVWSGQDLATVNSMAAFPYTITYTPGEDNAAHEIQVNWNSQLLQLDYFDEHYGSVVTDDGTKESTLQLFIQPNEKLKLVFYRADGFDLGQITPSQFHDLIDIIDLDRD